MFTRGYPINKQRKLTNIIEKQNNLKIKSRLLENKICTLIKYKSIVIEVPIKPVSKTKAINPES